VAEIRLDKHSENVRDKAEVFLKFTAAGIICYVVYDYRHNNIEFKDHIAHKIRHSEKQRYESQLETKRTAGFSTRILYQNRS
jgi:hypothetical protein